MKNIKVAIPLKTNSERIPNKNLRPFCNGESLFDIKAKQLLKVFALEDVYVFQKILRWKRSSKDTNLIFISGIWN